MAHVIYMWAMIKKSIAHNFFCLTVGFLHNQRDNIMIYSNPRKLFITNDWPYGRELRTTATFMVEQAKRGERVSRVTINPKNGRENKPKTTTYAHKVRIVDGDDGRTYIAKLTIYGHISIMESNLQYQKESIHPEDGERYKELLALFDEVQS